MFKKIVKIVLYVVISILVLFKICSLVHIPFFDFQMFQVISGSMEPTIKVGDIIIIKKSNDVKVGDVVTYIDDNEYITHRVVSIDKDKVVTKGDANNTNDSEIKKSMIMGKYVLTITKYLEVSNIILIILLFLVIGDIAYSMFKR